MSNLLNSEAFNTAAKDKFPKATIEFQVPTMGNGAKLYLFFISFENEMEIKTAWTEIRNFIAFEIQSSIEDDFSKWNFYLFFRVRKPLKKDLKYKIENDTFSSRKIVVDFNIDKNQVIKDHIINDDLVVRKLSPDESPAVGFEKNAVIENALMGKRIKGKKKKTEEVWDVLEEINLSLKSKDHES